MGRLGRARQSNQRADAQFESNHPGRGVSHADAAAIADSDHRRYAMTRHSRLAHLLVCFMLIGMAALLLACGVGGLTAGRPPRWACPSPTPLPWGEGGPIKEQIALPTAVPSGPQEYENVYYAEWEREYGAGGSLLGAQDPPFNAPFPSPTPYSITGLNYTLGQRIEVWPFHVQVSAHSGAVVMLPGVAPNTQQL